FRLRLQLPVILLDERADVVGHVEQPRPLFLVERDGEPAEAVDGDAALFAHLQRDAARLPVLEPLVLLSQPLELGLDVLVAPGHLRSVLWTNRGEHREATAILRARRRADRPARPGARESRTPPAPRSRARPRPPHTSPDRECERRTAASTARVRAPRRQPVRRRRRMPRPSFLRRRSTAGRARVARRAPSAIRCRAGAASPNPPPRRRCRWRRSRSRPRRPRRGAGH